MRGEQESGPILLWPSEGRNQFARLANRKAIIRNTVHPLGSSMSDEIADCKGHDRGFFGYRPSLFYETGSSSRLDGVTFPALAQQAVEQVASSAGSGQNFLDHRLARYATDLKYADLPEDVVRIVKRSILDTFGCAIGGYSAGPSHIAIKLASDVSSKQGATVLLQGTRTSPDLAVFANGVMIRYLDFNDAFVSLTHGAGHPSDTIAALLTAAELTGRSGRDLITATVLAYEVFCKVGDVFDYLGNGIDHSTMTGIAAVVGAGRLMGLTADAMVHAIGITVGGSTATRQG